MADSTTAPTETTTSTTPAATLKRSADSIDHEKEEENGVPDSKRANMENKIDENEDKAKADKDEKKEEPTTTTNFFASAVSRVDSNDGGFAFGQKPSGFGSSGNAFGSSEGGGFGGSGGGFNSSSAFGGGFTKVDFGQKSSLFGVTSASSLTSSTTTDSSTTSSTTPAFGTAGSGTSTLFGNFGSSTPSLFGSSNDSSGTLGTSSSTTPKLFSDFKPLFASAEPLAAEKESAEAADKKAKSVFNNVEAPKSGEEEEHKVFTLDDCKLFVMGKLKTTTKNEDGTEEEKEVVQYQERSHGKLTVNDASDKKSRLVMRQDTTKVLCLNAPVWHGMKAALKGPKFVQFTAINYATVVKDGEERKPEVFLIRGNGAEKKNYSSASEIKDLLQVITSRVPEPPADEKENTTITDEPAQENAKTIEPETSSDKNEDKKDDIPNDDKDKATPPTA